MHFQLVGEPGITRPCLVALDRILSVPAQAQRATVLTKYGNAHLFLLWERFEGSIIQAGFRSGHGGEGVRGFSLALCMLHEHKVPIDHVGVDAQVFHQIEGGYLPRSWQTAIAQSASPCAMPIAGWTLKKHWELAQDRRLWRVQGWRWTDAVIQWNDSAQVIDRFNWELGDQLNQVCGTVAVNSHTGDCQQVGLILRDTWIEFSHIVRESLSEAHENIGKSDVKRIISILDLPQDLEKGRIGPSPQLTRSSITGAQHPKRP